MNVINPIKMHGCTSMFFCLFFFLTILTKGGNFCDFLYFHCWKGKKDLLLNNLLQSSAADKKGLRDTLGVIFHITPLQHIL